MLTTRYCI